MEGYLGKYKAFVRDTNDPERRGRLRCYCPQVMGEESDTPEGWLGWAEACLPALGGGTGLDYAVPLSAADTGHEVPVWVEFEAGNVDHPIWVGCGVYAPTTKDPSLVKTAVSGQVGMPGQGLWGQAAQAGAGSTDGSMNPPYAAPDQGDQVISVKAGVRLVLNVQGGGTIILDGACIDIVAPMVRINGKTFLASLEEIVSLEHARSFREDAAAGPGVHLALPNPGERLAVDKHSVCSARL